MEKRYFEDVDTGERHELGSWSVTRDAIVEKQRSETNPAIGDVRIRTTGTNPDGQKTVSWINNFLLQRRDSE